MTWKNIEIPFNEWSRKRLGITKFGTTRNKKYGETGDLFIVDGYEYQLIHVIKLPLIFVRNVLYGMEGASCPEEFEKVWIEIHPRKGFEIDKKVWYHHFRVRKKLP